LRETLRQPGRPGTFQDAHTSRKDGIPGPLVNATPSMSAISSFASVKARRTTVGWAWSASAADIHTESWEHGPCCAGGLAGRPWAGCRRGPRVFCFGTRRHWTRYAATRPRWPRRCRPPTTRERVHGMAVPVEVRASSSPNDKSRPIPPLFKFQPIRFLTSKFASTDRVCKLKLSSHASLGHSTAKVVKYHDPDGGSYSNQKQNRKQRNNQESRKKTKSKSGRKTLQDLCNSNRFPCVSQFQEAQFLPTRDSSLPIGSDIRAKPRIAKATDIIII
jgi:hypothetical protein